MGKVQTSRKLAMQLLFQLAFNEEKEGGLRKDLLIENQVMEESKKNALELAEKAWEEKEQTDTLIKKYAIDWKMDRINIVDKSLLRLGFYELLYTETAESVIINEILELAKKFSTNESSKFINGILGAYVKDLKEDV
ncbi:MAG: transcription antitermination factor NusB [bacterium]